MSSIIRFAFSYAGVILALGFATAWLWKRPASRTARRFLVCVISGYTLASLYVLPYGVSRVLVAGFHRFSPADLSAGSTAIVVLGSGAVFVRDWDQRQLSFPDGPGAARVLEASRVYSLVGDAWVISSGGAVNSQAGASTTGATMRDALAQLSVPTSRILVEGESRSTHDEAVLIAPMLRSLHLNHVILVTSDFHMRRSLGTFRAVDITAIPAIALDPMISRQWYEWVSPSYPALLFTGSVVHEFLAIGFYAARGWLRL